MKKEKNYNLLKFSTQTPWQFVFVVLLYTIGAVGFPTSVFTFFIGESENARMIALFLSRALCSILPIWLIFEIRANKILRIPGCVSKFFLIIPFLLVVINNFPILPLIEKTAFLSSKNDFTKWICYLFAVLGGAFLEEVTFRGLVFTTLYRHFKDKKLGEFWAVFASSALFGVVHLVNLLGGAGIGAVVMQIGYSFLIGGMCSIALLKTGSFFNAVLLHFIFNVGGLLYEYDMITGSIWTTNNVILTAVLAVIVIIYAIILLFKYKNGLLNERLALGDVYYGKEQNEIGTDV